MCDVAHRASPQSTKTTRRTSEKEILHLVRTRRHQHVWLAGTLSHQRISIRPQDASPLYLTQSFTCGRGPCRNRLGRRHVACDLDRTGPVRQADGCTGRHKEGAVQAGSNPDFRHELRLDDLHIRHTGEGEGVARQRQSQRRQAVAGPNPLVVLGTGSGQNTGYHFRYRGGAGDDPVFHHGRGSQGRS